MTLHNPWFLLALVGTVGLYHLNLLASLLNMSALKAERPEALRDVLDQETHERSLEYARVSSRLEVQESSVQLALFLAFWWGGGFARLDMLARGMELGPIQTGLVIVSLLYLLKLVIALPFEIYDTFVVEREFGFNRMMVRTFALDRVKGLLLTAALGLPLMALLFWLFMKTHLAALYGWMALGLFSVLGSFLAPRLVMPLFFKFTRLEDAELLRKIQELAARMGFPVRDVSVVDGSRRSTKANAFFAGFGRAKRIALFDTLLANHGHDEILAVLAHEIGHHKKGHVPKQMIFSLAVSALFFAWLHYALHDPLLGSAFGVEIPSIPWALVFFSIATRPVSFLTSLVSGWMSRRFEFQADAFAKEAMSSSSPMVTALKKLSRDHLSNPSPHPLHVFLNYSHPPVIERIEALNASNPA